MAAAAQCAAPTTQGYQRRRPEQTLWYRIVQTHLETWLELASGADGESPPAQADAHNGTRRTVVTALAPATVHRSSARATAVGGGSGGTGGERPSVGCVRPVWPADRVRSAHRLVGAGRSENKTSRSSWDDACLRHCLGGYSDGYGFSANRTPAGPKSAIDGCTRRQRSHTSRRPVFRIVDRRAQ